MTVMMVNSPAKSRAKRSRAKRSRIGDSRTVVFWGAQLATLDKQSVTRSHGTQETEGRVSFYSFLLVPNRTHACHVAAGDWLR